MWINDSEDHEKEKAEKFYRNIEKNKDYVIIVRPHNVVIWGADCDISTLCF